MSEHQLEVEARDLLFFRDARPVSGSSIGNGGTWPLPSTVHSAIAAAMHRIDGQTAHMEGNHHAEKDKKSNRRRQASYRLGGLKTLGAFPIKDGEVYFPTPGDLLPSGSDDGSVAYLQPVEFPGAFVSNLPFPLKYGVASTEPPSKNKVGGWISAKELGKYLKGEKNVKTLGNDDFYRVEVRPGIGINADTGTVEEHQFYMAEYMRLNPDVRLWMRFECLGKSYEGREVQDIGEEALKHGVFDGFVLGGQRGLVYGNAPSCGLSLPPFVCKGTRVKWTLLTPGNFANGWMPSFVKVNDGSVYLYKETKTENREGSRRVWRQQPSTQVKGCIDAHLVASRISRGLAVSGWRLDATNGANGVPKATKMLVPAGSVYYFECADEESAQQLCKALHGVCKSDDANHGYGFGVCSGWDLKTF